MLNIILYSIILFSVFPVKGYPQFTGILSLTSSGERNVVADRDIDTTLLLIMAAEKGDSDSVEVLIEAGYDVNFTTGDGVTALMYAASGGHADIVFMLVENEAELDLIPFNGITALAGAVINNHYETALYLLQQGADPEIADDRGVTPLMHASSRDLFEMTELLLMFGADPNATDYEGATALHGAAIYARPDIAWLLLDYGAGINNTDDFRFTPLMMAVQLGRIEITEYLIENNAAVNVRTRDGMTPLAIAIANDQPVIARMLIDRGADPHARISETDNLMNLARWRENRELTDLLREYGVRRNIIPDFSIMQVSFNTMFNTGDFFNGPYIGLEDNKYNLLLSAGWSTRPVRRAVLVEFRDNWDDQLWEQRHLYFGSLHKRFPIERPFAINDEGFYAGFRVMYSKGRYWGTYRYPAPKWHIVPSAGYYKEGSWWFYTVGYEYINLDILRKHGHRITAGAGIRFGIKKDPLIYRTTYW